MQDLMSSALVRGTTKKNAFLCDLLVRRNKILCCNVDTSLILFQYMRL